MFIYIGQQSCNIQCFHHSDWWAASGPSTNRTIPPQPFMSCGASATSVGDSLSKQERSDHPFNSFYKKCKRKVSKRKMLATLFNLFRHHCALPNFHTSDCHHMGDSTQLPPKTQIFQFHDCWGEGQENMSTSKLTYSPSDDDRSFSTIFRGFSRLF